MGVRDPRVDAYISRQREFAQPILTHLREVIHKACPTAVETIKWGVPFFLYNDQMLCHMSAFKAHASLGFWKASLIDGLGAKDASGDGSAGNFGRLVSLDHLPTRRALTTFVKAAMKLNDERITAPRKKSAQKARPGSSR